MKHIALLILCVALPGGAVAQNLSFPGLNQSYDVQQNQGLDTLDVVESGVATPDADTIARQAAMDAASEPKTDEVSSGIQFSGSLTVGYNSLYGSYGGGSISATKENIGGSQLTGSISYIDGF